MKYAFVDGQRQEAQLGRPGVCPVCNSPVVAKCGDVRIYHWAHRGRRDCDPWWENETEWHLNWKNKFPSDWQEFPYTAENGEKHRADIKTDQGWVLEFQHSKINPDERKAREAFYQKMVWVVDGARRKNDKSQFSKALEGRKLAGIALDLWKILVTGECALLRDWTDSRTPVFFDFSGCDKPEYPYLWCLIRVVNGKAYVLRVLREDFMKYHSPEAKINNMNFLELLENFNKITEMIEIMSQPRKAPPVDPMALLQNRKQPRMGLRRF